MGGKHKQAQRVKNNARPSSSGRSAERLGVPFAPAPFANAFATHKDIGTHSLATEEPLPPLDPSLDPQFQVVLKKMSKKDGTTKLKALNEFRQLVEMSDAQAVGLMTGLWCRVYVGLLSGAECRVREAAHRAHQAVCTRAARSLAPHVRLLAAPWLAAVHDTYGPAAQAARDSLHAAFPDENRRAELAIRCRRQLLQQAIEALEAEPRDERAVACMLCAVAAACDCRRQLQPDDEVVALLHRLLEDVRFWAVESATNGERVGWAAVLAVVCRDPWRDTVTVDGKRVMRAVLTALWRTAPLDATTSLWDVVLQLLPTHGAEFELCTELIAPLLRQLREPGPGVVTRVCPVLLPLLAALPPSLASEASAQLLDALLECMNRSYVQHSRVELTAAAAAYMDVAQWSCTSAAPAECVRYVLCGREQGQPPPRHARCVQTELARLLRRWRDVHTADTVWQELAKLTEETVAQQVVADVIVWLARPASSHVRSKDQRVTFGEDGDDASTVRAAPSTATVSIDEPWYLERVHQLAGIAADQWLQCCNNQQVAGALLTVLREVGIPYVLPQDRPRAAYDLHVSIALCDAAAMPAADFTHLVDLAFLLLVAIDDEEHLLNSLDALPSAAVPRAIHVAQHEPYYRRASVVAWLHGSSVVRDVYVSEGSEAAANVCIDHVPDVKLLKRALLADPALCDDLCVALVTNMLCAALDAGRQGQAICELAAAACRHEPLKFAPRLLYVACSMAGLDSQTFWDVDMAWRDAVSASPDSLLEPMLAVLLKSLSYGDKVVTCAVHLCIATAEPARVLGRVHQRAVRQRVERCVALAQHMVGHNACDGMRVERLPTVANLAPWLAWERLVAATLERLLSTESVKQSDRISGLVVRVLRSYSLVACFSRHYPHTEHADQLCTWLEYTRKLCEQLGRLCSPSEAAWWASAPRADGAVECAAWAACTVQLAIEQLLPAGVRRTFGHRCPHLLHVVEAAGALGVLDPRRVPAITGGRPLLRPRLALQAADDAAVPTAVAEALHDLRSSSSMTGNVNRHMTDACLLLEVALRRAADNEALLDLATARVAEWSKDAQRMDAAPCLLAAYCRLAVAHLRALSGERADEHEQLFAEDVRRTVVRAFSVAIELAMQGSPAAWPLCVAIRDAVTCILVPMLAARSDRNGDTMWRMCLRALAETRCVPVQQCAHDCLRQLCDVAGGRAPTVLVETLGRLQDDTQVYRDERAMLACILTWDAAAVLHSAWEQPRADRMLRRLLDLVPQDAKDEWFVAAGPAEDGTNVRALQRAACRAYARWLSEAGAAARSWWIRGDNLSAGDRQRAERLAARHVTRAAVRVQLAATRLPDGVRCTTSGRFVQAECSVEDARIELRVELGESWPLGQQAPCVVARPAPHRDRLMQLTLAAAAGAPLHHLLRLWKDAVDSRYEGLDECHICFSLLHAATAQLPKLRCSTCRKTFHSACLYRWFSTSNKSTCPICRDLF